MRRLALMLLAVVPTWTACGTAETQDGDIPFAKANELMAEEIRHRILQIPYQHRQELFNNLLWLAQTGEQAIPELLEALKSKDAKVRSNAAWVLGQIGDRRAIPYVEPLAQDVTPSVRLEAARTLLAMGDMRSAPAMIDALDNDEPQVRYLCHEALKQATGQDFGYDHLTDDMDQRRRAVWAWRKWWAGMSNNPGYADHYAIEYGLMPNPAEEMTPAAPMGETAPAKPQATTPAEQGTTKTPQPGGENQASTGSTSESTETEPAPATEPQTPASETPAESGATTPPAPQPTETPKAPQR